MERKSSIHIEAGKVGEFFHNDRTKLTANSIFSTEDNYYSLDAINAIELYKKDLKEKTKIYTERTGRSLHKNTITLMSAILNLDKQHTKEDIEKVCKYLEKSLDTKIYQVSIHRDEGFVNENGEKVINEHGHLLFAGLDSEGRSVRKKLTKNYLINLQTEVAKILKMQRGINYTKEQKKRPKRLGTYEYKEHKKRETKTLKPVLIENKKINEENEEIKKELAKVKDLNEINNKLRKKLKELGAVREDYKYLELSVKNLKEQIKNKQVTIEKLQEKMAKIKEELQEEIEKRKEEKNDNDELRDVLANDYKEIEELEQQLNNKKQEEEKIHTFFFPLINNNKVLSAQIIINSKNKIALATFDGNKYQLILDRKKIKDYNIKNNDFDIFRDNEVEMLKQQIQINAVILQENFNKFNNNKEKEQEEELAKVKKEKEELEEKLRKKREEEAERLFKNVDKNELFEDWEEDEEVEIEPIFSFFDNKNNYFEILEELKNRNLISDFKIDNNEKLTEIETNKSKIVDKKTKVDIKFNHLNLDDKEAIREEVNKILDIIEAVKDWEFKNLRVNGKNEKLVKIFEEEIAKRVGGEGGKPQEKEIEEEYITPTRKIKR